MGKKKRPQETTNASLSLSSSSFRSTSNRQETVSPANQRNHVRTADAGCMSGIFQLMSKYHTRRKFLTFGRKQERNATSDHAPPPAPEKTPPPNPEPTSTCHPRDRGLSPGRVSLDQTPRSPAIPPEVRRSSTDSPVNSPRLVARLMGLEDIPATPPPPDTVASPAVEKRRKLLGALEKCDEDLKALKKIIEAVRATQTPPRVVAIERREEAEEKESEVGSDGPSPVSVLDHHHLSPRYSKRTPNEKMQQQQQQKPKQQKQQMPRKKPGDHVDKPINFTNKPSFSAVITTIPHSLHYPTSKIQQFPNNNITSTTKVTPTPWHSAMKESVIEVCRDVQWGQRQEVARIGLVLQDFILRELVDDIIKDMTSTCFHAYYSTYYKLLPFEACKRKLSF